MNNSDEPTSARAAEPKSGLAAQKDVGLPGSNGVAPVASSGIRTWALALATGLAAGVIAWAIGEAALIPDSGLARGQGNSVLPASAVGLRNAVVSFGTLGAALGLGLGLAGGLIHRSVLRTVLTATTGVVLGAVTGLGMARLLVPVFYKNLGADDLTYSLIVHGGTWGAVDAAAGLAFGQGLGGWGRMLRVTVGGAGAALFATAIYEFAGSILFPLAMTNLPVSVTKPTRLAARLLVTLLVAAGVVRSAGSGGEGQGAGDAKDLKDVARHAGGATASG
jgi:hypothetical protein